MCFCGERLTCVICAGEASFFVQPGEILEKKQPNFVLKEGNAVVVTALENFKDEQGERRAGERWLVHGPAVSFFAFFGLIDC
jgi:hypothetical protein